jgi:hypothetical protein
MVRVIPPGHRSITGSLPTRYPARQLNYESKLERDFLLVMEIEHGVHDVATQPMTVELEVAGKRRIYTPDVLVTWDAEARLPHGVRQVVFEVKPLDVLRRDFTKLGPKYREAKRHFRRQGIGFRVVTERTIRRPRLENAKVLAPTMKTRPEGALIDQIVLFMQERATGTTIGELRGILENQGAIRGVAMDAIYHFIGYRFIECDLERPLVDSTPLEWWLVRVMRSDRG